jgi:hypothetical protein
MKQFYTISILFLLPFFCFSQNTYKPGYVITLKGDTIHGFIDYREWGSNPNSITFRASISDSKKRTFSPEEISYFSVNDIESYQSYTGKISMDMIDPDRLSTGRDSSFKIATVFLKVLQKGDRLTVYSFADAVKTRFYIKESSDAAPVELVYKIYYNNNASNAGDIGKSVEDNTYLKQLLSIGQKYNVWNDSFQWAIDHANYSKGGILNITSRINGLAKGFYDKQNRDQKDFDLFIGIALNSTTTKPAADYQRAGGGTYTSVLPAASFGINFFMNPTTRKLIFRGEIIIAENQYKSNYINKLEPYIPIKYSYNQLAVAFAPQAIYNIYNADNLKVFLDFGVALTLSKYSNEVYGSQDGKTPVNSINTNNPSDFSTYSTIILFKAGVQLNKKIGLFAAYQGASSVSNDVYFQLNYTSIQLGVNYFFL